MTVQYLQAAIFTALFQSDVGKWKAVVVFFGGVG